MVMIKSSSREEQEPTSEGVANANGGDEEETKEEDRAARIERLKSGFRISEREGRLMGKWEKVKQGEDNSVVVPTPTSASSCSSLVKPLAERRPISPATLTHVTMLPPPLINLNESPPPIPPPVTISPFSNIANKSGVFFLNDFFLILCILVVT